MIAIIVILSIALIVASGLYFNQKTKSDIEKIKMELELEYRNRLEHEKRDFISRSSSINKGFNYEKLAPHLEGFPYNPRNLIFFGKPIDYVCFEENENGEYNIVFIDIKTGTARLTREQKMIQDAIKSGRISFHEIKIKDGGAISKSKKTDMPVIEEIKEPANGNV